MPTIGGVSIGWDNTTPADTESAGLGDDRVRSLKTSLQQALDAEHNFPSAGGANIGYHVLGSARVFSGPQSAVSSTGSHGRLMLTSNTTRLFEVGTGVAFLGGEGTLVVDGTAYGGWPTTHYWAVEFGTQVTEATTGIATVTIPNSGYSGVPIVFASIVTTAAPGAIPRVVNVVQKTSTTFGLRTYLQSGGELIAAQSDVDWVSIGTRTTGLV